MLVAYIVIDVLLTPLAHIETRDPSLVTTIGIVTLVLLFVGLALSVIALVLLFRKSGRSRMFAIVAALLYFPAPIVELSGHFSSLRAPTAIAWLELVQAVVALIIIAVGFWSLQRGPTKATRS